jgi:23S rRNA pseudouridine1911/1915/1917 synthase
MPLMTTWTVTESHAGERLDVFVVAQTGKTRNAVQRAIKAGIIQVNGTNTAVHQFLKTGDTVTWNDAPITDTKAQVTLPEQAPAILAETDGWIVLDKPVGLLVHPAHHQVGTPSLADWLVAHFAPIAKIGEDPARPGIVHRLDREVSGLLVAAKTQAAFDDLKKQFASRTVEKKYTALVHGAVPQEEGDIKLRIARSSSKARMAARPEGETGGKAAWTHYRVLERFKGATLLELTILSGRTHQIRAHLHGIGHPVIGDSLYARKQTDRRVQAPRVMLQSTFLAFNDPATGERKTFTLPPDPAFAALAQEFRIS